MAHGHGIDISGLLTAINKYSTASHFVIGTIDRYKVVDAKSRKKVFQTNQPDPHMPWHARHLGYYGMPFASVPCKLYRTTTWLVPQTRCEYHGQRYSSSWNNCKSTSYSCKKREPRGSRRNRQGKKTRTGRAGTGSETNRETNHSKRVARLKTRKLRVVRVVMC